MLFEFDKLYRMDYTGLLMFGRNTSGRELAELFRDGRKSGLLIESSLANTFENIRRVNNEKSSYDLVISGIGKTECKVVTKGGVDLRPSCQKGVGRVQDDDAAWARVDSVECYILPDIREMPVVKVYAMTNDTIRYINKLKLTVKDIENLRPQIVVDVQP